MRAVSNEAKWIFGVPSVSFCNELETDALGGAPQLTRRCCVFPSSLLCDRAKDLILEAKYRVIIMSKEEDQSDIGSTKDVMYDAQLDPSTPQLFALPGENQDALEDRLFELENFLDMMDNGSPAVIDPNIFMAIVGHSAERSNASISENPICSMEYSLKNTPEEASSLVNAASSLLGLTTNHEASIDMRYELSRKRSVVQHGSEEDKRAKTVSSTTTGIISNESHSFDTYPVGKSLDGNTISNSKQQGSLKPDCNIGPRKGSRATTPLKQTSQESNHMSCVPLQAYQSMKLR